MKIGLIADIHGDLAGFRATLRLLENKGVERILCAGDILDRGPDADTIVRLLQEYNVVSIKGNHDHTVIHHQDRWRASDNPERLTQLGRIISDQTVDYVRDLPDEARFTFEGVRLLMAHGTPWSDVMAVFSDSRQGVFEQLVERYADDTDVVVLGHTHTPMRVWVSGMWILNPGSVYGVTVRDSNTCAALTLPECEFEVFSLKSSERVHVPVVQR